MRLLERVESEQVCAERRAVLACVVPARVERREPIAGRPGADLAELRQTRRRRRHVTSAGSARHVGTSAAAPQLIHC